MIFIQIQPNSPQNTHIKNVQNKNMDSLMCTAYTDLANTFLISFPSKNSDLSSMLEA